jgi:hypothetical protein
MSDIYDGDISNNSNNYIDTDTDTYSSDSSSQSSHMVASIRKKIKRQIENELNNYGDDEMVEDNDTRANSDTDDTDNTDDTDDTDDTSDIEIEDEGEELFVDNLECVEPCDCPDIYFVEDNSDYEIINESKCIPIKNRYRRQTWYEYFRKLYMVTVILIISIVVYFYYSYSRRKENIVSKL